MKAQSQFKQCGGKKPIGTHRHTVMGGPNIVKADSPIYDKRNQFLPSIGRTMFQVQTCFLGSLIWINVNSEDVK